MSVAGHSRGSAPLLSRATAGAAAVGLAFTLFSGAAAASSVPSSCPSASSLRSAAGQALTRTESVGAEGSLICSYQGRHDAELGVEVIPVKGITSALYSTYLKEAAEKYKAVKVQSIRGLGEAAVEYTQPNTKSNPNRVPTTGVVVIASSKEVVVAGSLPAKNVLAIARAIV